MAGRLRAWWRARVRIPAAVLAACLLLTTVGACWSVLAPLGEAPDEPAHLALVLHLADGHGYPRYDGLHNPLAIIRLCATYAAATRACPRPGEPVTLTSTRLHPRADAPDKGSRPAWDDAGGDRPLGQLNQMPQHPPLYYEGMALVLRAERSLFGGPWSTDRELALLRLVDALLLLPLPALAWWTARRVGLDQATAVTASFVPLGLPMLTHIGGTLNNDTLLTLSGAVLVALLAGVLRGDLRRTTALAVGIATAVGLLTKAFAVLFPPLVVAAYAIALLRARRPHPHPHPHAVPPTTSYPGGPERAVSGTKFEEGARDGSPTPTTSYAGGPERAVSGTKFEEEGVGEGARGAVVGLAVAGVTAAVLAGWWYVHVRVATGRFAPSVEDRNLTTALRLPGFHADPLAFLGRFARDLDQRFWGSFGWYTVRLSTGLTYLLTAVLLAALATAFLPSARRFASADLGDEDVVDEDVLDEDVGDEDDQGDGGGPHGHGPVGWVDLAFLLAPTALLVAFVAQRAWGLHVRTSKYQFIQGRYLLAGVVGLAVVAAVGVRRWAGRWAPIGVAAGAALLQLWSVRRVLAGWWGGPGLGPRGQVRAMVAWSAWPGEALGVLALATAAALAATVWTLVRDLRGPGAGQGRPVGSERP